MNRVNRGGANRKQRNTGNFQPTAAAFNLIQTLYKTRYSPIGHLWKGCMHFESSRCPKIVSMSESERKETTTKVNDIVNTFTPLVDLPNGLAVTEMLLNDYIERLSTFVAGVEGSCMYLRCIGEQYAFRVVA